MPSSPGSTDELMQAATLLAGKSLGEIASLYHIPVPENLKKEKGWVGELLEIALGATARNLPEPDFQLLGIELKTIPLNKQNRPKESTFVCTANLNNPVAKSWEVSTVKKKLNRVLWLPVEADHKIQIAKRKIGSALLWSPNEEQEMILKNDWFEIMERIWTGELETVNASLGEYLQLRPKAAHGKSLCETINAEGEKILTLPRGFYLRSEFTRQILDNYYHNLTV